MTSHTFRSTLIVTVLDVGFNVMLAVCFLAVFDIQEAAQRREVVRLLLLIYAPRTVFWLGLRIWLLRPLDAWLRNEHDPDLLRKAGRAIYNFPLVYTLLYSVMFVGMYALLTVMVIMSSDVPVSPRSAIGGLLFAISIGFGSFAVGFPLNLFMLAPTSRRISLPAQEQLAELPGINLSVRAKIILLSMCLGLTPTLFMVGVQYMFGVRADLNDVAERSRAVAAELADTWREHGEEALYRWQDVPGVFPFVVEEGEPWGGIVLRQALEAQPRLGPWLARELALGEGRTVVNPRLEAGLTTREVAGQRVGALVSTQQDDPGPFLYTILLVALLASSWALLSAALMGQTVADPVTRIAAVVSEVSQTGVVDGNKRAPVIYQDEIGTLAAGTNRMLESLAASQAAVKEYLAKLEAKNLELERAYRFKGQFLANMSHELRTPLNAIIGFSKLMLRKTRDTLDKRQFKNLELIHQSGNQLLALVNDILDFERIEAGGLKIAPSEVDCEQLAQQLEATLGPLAQERGLTLSAAVEEPPMKLWVDPDRLRQIMVNFITNSIKYSDQGHIQASFRRAGDEVRIAVSDQGLGIPRDHLARVFEPFHMVDPSDTRERGGAGLGLAIVKKLAHLMGGSVEAESELGQGSTFTLVLPARALMGAGEPGIDSLDAQGTGPDVLVVDDQVQFLEMMHAELTEAGFRVHLARTGEEGLQKVRDLQPAAVLLDIVMPGMGGWDVLKELRRSPDTAATAVIITSVLDDAPVGYELGIAAWLTKPVDVSEFRRVMEGLSSRDGLDILVVEDDEATWQLLQEELEGLGASVRVARDGRRAVEELKAGFPSALVLDLGLPEVDGFGVLDELRAMPGGEDVPVIIYTARDLSDDDRARLGERLVQVVKKHGTDSPTQVLRALRRRGLLRSRACE